MSVMEWTTLTSLICFSSSVFIYYYRHYITAPIKLHSKANTKFSTLLKRILPILSENYGPTFWCFESRLQTVFAALLRKSLLKDINYRREILKLQDEGEVSLDWLDTPDSAGPVILFLPGLTGDSQSEYIKTFVNLAHFEMKARCVVFNFRGRGGHQITTPKTYCASKGDDLDEVVGHIKEKYPKSTLIGLGVSLGGIILGNYLAEQGDKARLDAAFLVSVCFDTFKGTESLESGFNRLLNRHLANCLVKSIREVRHHFDKSALYDLEKVFSSRTIREFDSSFTSKLFGYNDVSEYYKDACIGGKLDRIRIPTLALNALDDPFSPGRVCPWRRLRSRSTWPS